MTSVIHRPVMAVLSVIAVGFFSGFGAFYLTESIHIGFLLSGVISIWAYIQRTGEQKND